MILYAGQLGRSCQIWAAVQRALDAWGSSTEALDTCDSRQVLRLLPPTSFPSPRTGSIGQDDSQTEV